MKRALGYAKIAHDWLLARLSRVTSTGRIVKEIDGLRFVAIAVVVLFHAHFHFFHDDAVSEGSPVWDGVKDYLKLGWFGVELFFVISGFILAIPFAERLLERRPASDLGKYYLRRLTRLEPPYIISLLIYLFYFGNLCDVPRLLPHFLASMTYTHWLFYRHASDLNHVTWSLEIEVQFYLLAPLLCQVFAVRSTWLRRGILLAGILASAAQWQWAYHEFLGLTIVATLRWFLAGLLLADIYLVEWKGAPTKSFLWDLVGAAAWWAVPTMLMRSDYMPVGPIKTQFYLLPVAIVIAYVGAFRGRVLNRFFTSGWIVAVGGMCYTIYLYHIQYIWRVEKYLGEHIVLGRQPTSFLQLLLNFVGVVAACSVLYVLFEKPFMYRDWPAKLMAVLRRLWMAPLRAWKASPPVAPERAADEA